MCKKRKNEIEHLNRVLNAIRSVNRLIVKEKDIDRLLNGVCTKIISTRGYHNAWIALITEPGKLLKTAEAGLGKIFLPMSEQLKHGELTECGRRALNQSGVLVIDDPSKQCIDCPLSQIYEGRSGMIVQLKYHERVFGFLTVSIPAECAADEEEQDLFHEVANDVAYALYSIELEKEKNRVQEALVKSEESFRNLVENSLIGIFIIQDGQIVYKNPEMKGLAGPLDRAGKLFDVISIHPDDDEKVKKFYKSITSRKTQTLDTDFRFYPVSKVDSRADMKWVYCRASLIEYQGKEAILVNMTDITRSKEMEHLLKIQDKMSSLGRVAAGIAHEIRNPLSGINIYLNTLEKIYGKTSEKEESLEKVKKIFKQLQSASRKIESVIKRVMDFSKPSEPKFILTDINPSIEEAINLSSVTLRKSGVTIEKFLTANLPKCYMDPHLIEEVVLNLITNAAEAMKNMDREKRIKIESFMKNSHIFLRISDSGPGVLSHLRDKIFDPFYTTKNDSSGIGLSLSHRIITDHGGSVEVGLSELGGAGFMIKIPIKKEEDEE